MAHGVVEKEEFKQDGENKPYAAYGECFCCRPNPPGPGKEPDVDPEKAESHRCRQLMSGEFAHERLIDLFPNRSIEDCKNEQPGPTGCIL